MSNNAQGNTAGRPNPNVGQFGNPQGQALLSPPDQSSQFGAGFGGGRPSFQAPPDKYGDMRPTGRPAAESDNFNGGGSAPVGGGYGDQPAAPQASGGELYQRDGRMANFGTQQPFASGPASNSFMPQGGSPAVFADKWGNNGLFKRQPDNQASAPVAQAAQPMTPQMSTPYQVDSRAMDAPVARPLQPFIPQMSKPFQFSDANDTPAPPSFPPAQASNSNWEQYQRDSRMGGQTNPSVNVNTAPFGADFNGGMAGRGGMQYGNPQQMPELNNPAQANPWEASTRFNAGQNAVNGNGNNANFNQTQTLGAQPQAQQIQVSQAINAPQMQGDSGGGNNPNLQGVADNIRLQFGRGLTENALPALRGQALVNGQLGGSRQGIAEGLATGRAADGLAGALSNMYSSSYEADQGRKSQAAIAAMQANAQAAIASGQMQSQERMFNAGQANEMNRFGASNYLQNQNLSLQQQQLANSRDLGFAGLDVQRQGQGNQYALGVGGLQQQAMQNQTQRDLGFGNLDVSRQNQQLQGELGRGNLGINQQQANTQRDLGFGNLAAQRDQNANQFNLGMGNLSNAQQQTRNQMTLGMGGLQQQERQNQNQMQLGMGNLDLANRTQANNAFNAAGQLALGNRAQDNSYDLGLRANALGGRQADNQLAGINSQFQAAQMGNDTQMRLGQMNNETNRQGQQNQFALGMGNLGNQYMRNEQDFFAGQRGQDLQAYGLGAQLTGQGQQGMGQGLANVYNNANTTYNAPWDQLGRYNNSVGPYMGYGATNTQTQQQFYNPTQQWMGSIAQLVGAFNSGGGGGGGGAAATAAKVASGSDVRIKDNIKRVGTLDDGLPVYTFTYKGMPEQTHMGVMAQEAELLYPDAIHHNSDGVKFVDYSKLGV